ncbi:hypothetical protein CsSME_00043838 [Camellia sinensis var. sinensis]
MRMRFLVLQQSDSVKTSGFHMHNRPLDLPSASTAKNSILSHSQTDFASLSWIVLLFVFCISRISIFLSLTTFLILHLFSGLPNPLIFQDSIFVTTSFQQEPLNEWPTKCSHPPSFDQHQATS